jgi:hypothetical protein
MVFPRWTPRDASPAIQWEKFDLYAITAKVIKHFQCCSARYSIQILSKNTYLLEQ